MPAEHTTTCLVKKARRLDYAKIRSLYADGLGAAAIAERVGANPCYILELLQKWGISRSPSEANKIRAVYNAEQIRSLYADGSGVQAIARIVGCSESLVTYHLRSAGISPRADVIRLGKWKGENAPQWRGGRHHTSAGYVVVYDPDHHLANPKGYVREHCAVWEEFNGREIPKGWVIHHLNGIKDDNRPENLVAIPRTQHGTHTVKELLQSRIRKLEAKIKELENTLKGDSI